MKIQSLVRAIGEKVEATRPEVAYYSLLTVCCVSLELGLDMSLLRLKVSRVAE